ncbi:hypothetical protein RPATATE_1383 [Rickettsia parkeri str. Tate's Hell]|uniref:Uncharacterized protein n=1 Tax=Rickettsia parkeri str. Tate's Hell TaxID=1359189 RepID=A0ABR5DQ93_RICPA|nr:hypothetical protein [Rickettsia parkeri]AFC74482.1 hypothetical protein MC1_01610 [Rickettsia parkeri str. Portsmouth]KJV94540.1 hypothetical protein RPAGB_1348 [Rickettsia parkeri str. Grand Bay]KJV96575.1 hypothetical protein RPAAT24_1138 [Rickettsia parkeri str. AT\
MVRDKEAIYEPLKALLTLESTLRKNDYKKIKAIDKKDLAAFVQWKAAILPVVKDVSNDDSIKQPLIELVGKIAKLIPPLEFLCI